MKENNYCWLACHCIGRILKVSRLEWKQGEKGLLEDNVAEDSGLWTLDSGLNLRLKPISATCLRATSSKLLKLSLNLGFFLCKAGVITVLSNRAIRGLKETMYVMH